MQPCPSSAEPIDDLLAAWAADHDPRVRERIIVTHLELADRLALRYRNAGASLEDLRQTARAGLVAAVDRYQADRGTPFVAFAIVTVVGELKRYLRDSTWRLHVPRGVKQHVRLVRRATEEFYGTMGRPATVAELARRLGLSDDEVLAAIEADRSRRAVSLDAPAGEPGAVALSEFIPDPEPRHDLEDLILLPELIARLPTDERQAVLLYFFAGLRQQEIADRIGHSQMHVSRLLKRALTAMRDELLSGPPGP
jgi:RNA polymerase sigma-B factor